MDKKLQLIQHLYGEADDRAELRALLEEEDLKQEYQELNEAKFLLDHTKSERPDRAVLDTIFAAAAQPETESHTPLRPQRIDRAPVAHQRKTRRLFTPITALLALLITVGIGYQFMSDDALLSPQEAKQVASQSADISNNETDAPVLVDAEFDKRERALGEEQLLDAVTAEAAAPLAAEAARLAVASASVPDSSLPQWDDDIDDILHFQRRIDMLLEQNQDLNWDEAVVPLEMLPAGNNAGGPVDTRLRQAGSKRTKSGNQ